MSVSREEASTKIEELIKSNKIKFNTHRNRKAFVDNIIKIFGISDNPAAATSQYKDSVVRLTNKPSVGHAVMTSGESAKGDDSLNSTLAKKKSGRIY